MCVYVCALASLCHQLVNAFIQSTLKKEREYEVNHILHGYDVVGNIKFSKTSNDEFCIRNDLHFSLPTRPHGNRKHAD